ncbi:MAG: methyl-accepting chemotaxis protein [Desulfobacteraceae bacterium]|jgi:methyl-accepting chemotaxis protein
MKKRFTRNVGLKRKLLLPLLLTVLAGMIVVVATSYYKIKESIQGLAILQLEAIIASTSSSISEYVVTNKRLNLAWSQNNFVREAIEGEEGKSAKATERLKTLIAQFPALDNIFITDAAGLMISASTEESIGKVNVSGRDYFKQIMATGEQVLSDEVISKSTGKPIFVVASPVKKDGDIIGVFGISVQLKSMAEKITDTVKVGNSGYAFALNKHGENIAYPDKSQLFKINAKTFPTIQAIMDKKNGYLFHTFKGIEKIYVFKEEKEKGWIAVVTAPSDEVFEAASKIRNSMILYSFITLMSLWLIIRTQTERIVMKPIKRLNERMKDIAMGEADLTIRISDLSNDEVGELGRLFNTFVEKLHTLISEMAEKSNGLASSAGSLAEISSSMTSQSEVMQKKTILTAENAKEMNANMQAVATAMEQSSANTGMIAAAAEEMNATITEIARNTGKARAISDEAETKAEKVTGIVSNLEKSAMDIGKVTEVISEISEQTNLLALNATIEAARAGEAGKGFAVVANEIKELARQTADATDEITQKIKAIQGATSQASSEMNEITKVIVDVNSIVSGIAAAVEEQSATTKEIASNVAEVAKGIDETSHKSAVASEISSGITDLMKEMTQETAAMAESSNDVSKSSVSFSDVAGALRTVVKAFKI